MTKECLLEYPPSYTYNEIINKIDNKIGAIAYCYVGEREGGILLVDEMGSIKSLHNNNRVKHSEELSLTRNHELWVLFDDVGEDVFRQMFCNSIFYLYCEYFQYLQYNNVDLFNILKED